MNNITPEQLANFTYWVTEETTHRGAKKFSGEKRVAFIQHELLPLFLKKYPTGILTGWEN